MNFPLFIAKRIFSDQGDRRKVSRPAIRIATIGVAIGLAVMIVTISVVLGFKHTIRDKVVGFGSHITIQNVQSAYDPQNNPVAIDGTFLERLEALSRVNHAQRYNYAQGILKTDDDFLGVMFKGIGPEYDTQYLSQCVVEGELPQFCDTATTYPLVLSKTMADKLRLHAGDRVFAYFIGEDDVRARRFTVTGIYQTNMKRFDDAICLTDFYAAQRINGWVKNQCSGIELLTDMNADEAFFNHYFAYRSDLFLSYLKPPRPFKIIKQIYKDLILHHFPVLQFETNPEVRALLRHTPDNDGHFMASQTITESYPQVFSWLELLDINVWIILALMISLAGITMISGLLIIILERAKMIGILKALGARNSTIRYTFLWFAAFIIGRGLIIGNLLGIGIVVLQQQTGLITLDPQTYYVCEAPMELHFPLIILLNICTLFISVFVLVAPSYLVSRIRPAQSMRYE